MSTAPRPVYRRSIPELAKRIAGKYGRLTKVSGKPGATLPDGSSVRGIFSVHMNLFVRCDSPTNFIAITAAKTWREEDDVILIRTQNSLWKARLDELPLPETSA